MYDIENISTKIYENREYITNKKTSKNSVLYIEILFFTLFIISFSNNVSDIKSDPSQIISYTYSLNIYYIFHILVSKQDIFHNIHHILAILHQSLFIYYTNFETTSPCINSDFLLTMAIQYYMLITSIFSAMWKLAKNNNWKFSDYLENLYFYIFLLTKIGGNIIILKRWYDNKFYKIYIPCYILQQYSMILLAGIQMYFSYKIIKKLACKSKKIKAL